MMSPTTLEELKKEFGKNRKKSVSNLERGKHQTLAQQPSVADIKGVAAAYGDNIKQATQKYHTIL